MNRSARIVLAALLSSMALSASARECRSHVFLDADGDGVFDAGERGLRNVAVSDGQHIVRTDGNGRYRLKARPGGTLFVIKPPGFDLPRRADGLPDRFANEAGIAGLKYGGVRRSDSTCRDFALRPQAGESAPLSVLVFGDPQPKSAQDVDYYRRDIVEPLVGKADARLGISLGDIVHDDLTLLPALKAVDKSLGVPWLYAPGNHDLDFDAADDARSLESFRAQFGPDTFAWEEREANFIVLDDVVYRPGGTPDYIGGLRESQFHFLARYLAGADKNKLLVIAAHIPLFQTRNDRDTFRRADRQRLFRLLEPFRDVLLLTAHSHTQTHLRHGPDSDWHGAGRLHEYNAGAACGAFWSGVKDAAGIPDSTMSDGTPNGYARLTVTARDYRLQWFNARQAPQAAMTLHAPKVLRRGAYPSFGLYANVFMARPDTVVEARIDGGAWRPMMRVLQADPRVLAENLADDAAGALRAYDRIPEATPSSHLWRLPLPTDLPAGEHHIEVRARDSWLGEALESAVYRLQDAGP